MDTLYNIFMSKKSKCRFNGTPYYPNGMALGMTLEVKKVGPSLSTRDSIACMHNQRDFLLEFTSIVDSFCCHNKVLWGQLFHQKRE